jgi:hypothetical protein
MLVAPASSKEAVTHHAVGKQKKEECQDNYKQELSSPQPVFQDKGGLPQKPVPQGRRSFSISSIARSCFWG